MSRPGFLEGVTVAASASLAGGALYQGLRLLTPGSGALRLTVAGLAAGYLWYLLARAPSRVGAVSTVLAWALGALALWWLVPAASLYLALHVGALWLARSFHHQRGVLTAVADLGLSALGLGAAAAALLWSGSLLLACWCFFLTQALFSLTPVPRHPEASGPAADESNERFRNAHRAARAALHRLPAHR
jgi:hypothetical protein